MKTALASDFDGTLYFMNTEERFHAQDVFEILFYQKRGGVFGICLILLCLNIFTDFLLLAGSYSNKFYRLYTFGTAVAFIFQAFLTIGGEVKFIPLTGVTLPLVSYGGSSVLATFIMFGIIGAIFMLQEERLERFRQRYEAEHAGGIPGAQTRTETVSTGQYDAGRSGEDKDQDFYKDFKGVPIYDPRKDMENIDHFDV